MGESDLIEDETSFAYRLSNLRKDHDLSQKQLADQLHVTHSQISRIESGETKNPNISIVIDAARFFHVSTDYLLGITQITSPKSYDISELGLSEEAVTRLITRRIDVDILNRLLEHENFPKLCIMIRNYFDDTIAEGIMARNKVIDFAVNQLTDLMTAEPSKRKEIIKDKQFLSSQKLGANEADIEKIKIQFMAILRDIKSGMQKKEPTKAVATAEAVQMIRDALPDKPASDITSTDVANAVAFYMGQTTNLNAEGLAMVQNLAKYICDNSVSEKNSEDG
ncbi:helix-turn-helix transcriptional regulator [Lacrimispora saccharolytica]|nr:helix-turn-helix transcriptional regulator [Lacrimispora saccharolytica]